MVYCSPNILKNKNGANKSAPFYVDVVFREIAVVPSPTRHIISIKTDDPKAYWVALIH